MGGQPQKNSENRDYWIRGGSYGLDIDSMSKFHVEVNTSDGAPFWAKNDSWYPWSPERQNKESNQRNERIEGGVEGTPSCVLRRHAGSRLRGHGHRQVGNDFKWNAERSYAWRHETLEMGFK